MERWSEPISVREVVYAAVCDLTNCDTTYIFRIRDVKEVILKEYPYFNESTLSCTIYADCVNCDFRYQYHGNQDKYWKVGHGKYCLYDPKTHKRYCAEFNINLDEVDFNNFIIEEVQLSLSGSEPEEEEQEIPEDQHRYFVYAWRWCDDEGSAKIGRTRNGLKGVKNRMVTTYHPTDDPVLLGVRECADAEESHKTEQYILNELGRTRPDREWVEIDEKFNEMIEKSFYKPPQAD